MSRFFFMLLPLFVVIATSPVSTSPCQAEVSPDTSRFLDEVQDDLYEKTVLFGDRSIEIESQQPIHWVESKRVNQAVVEADLGLRKILLDGSWQMKGSTTRIETDLNLPRTIPAESQGTKNVSRNSFGS